jgi:hypothetical protein
LLRGSLSNKTKTDTALLAQKAPPKEEEEEEGSVGRDDDEGRLIVPAAPPLVGVAKPPANTKNEKDCTWRLGCSRRIDRLVISLRLLGKYLPPCQSFHPQRHVHCQRLYQTTP